MLLPSPLLRSHLITESTLQTTAIFFLSLRNKSAEELSLPVPCTLSSQHFTLPIMHSFSLQNKSSADPHTTRPLFPLKHDIRHVRKWGETSKQTEESREQRFSLYLRPYFHISRHCTNTGELVLTYWNGRRSNARLIIASQHCLSPSLSPFFHKFLSKATRNIQPRVQI